MATRHVRHTRHDLAKLGLKPELYKARRLPARKQPLEAMPKPVKLQVIEPKRISRDYLGAMSSRVGPEDWRRVVEHALADATCPDETGETRDGRPFTRSNAGTRSQGREFLARYLLGTPRPMEPARDDAPQTALVTQGQAAIRAFLDAHTRDTEEPS